MKPFSQIVYNEVHYNCVHFLIDAYKHYVGEDLSEKLLGDTNQFDPLKLKNFRKIDVPKQNCIVLLRDRYKAHVGLWRDNAMLHLDPKGVVQQPLHFARQYFKKVNFYETTA